MTIEAITKSMIAYVSIIVATLWVKVVSQAGPLCKKSELPHKTRAVGMEAIQTAAYTSPTCQFSPIKVGRPILGEVK